MKKQVDTQKTGAYVPGDTNPGQAGKGTTMANQNAQKNPTPGAGKSASTPDLTSITGGAENAAQTGQAGDKPLSGPGSAKGGAVPTMPMAAVWKTSDGRHTAAVIHPAGGQYAEHARGQGGAKGALEDAGFTLAALSLDAPAWLKARIPADAEVIGFAQVKSFPLPKQ